MQHTGLSCDAGLGPEFHAHAVAEQIGASRSARPLLDRSRGQPVANASRPYTEFTSFDNDALWVEDELGIPAKGSALTGLDYPIMVSDTFETLTNSSVSANRRSKVLFATEAIVKDAKRKLAAIDSGIELATNTSNAVEIQGERLVEVTARFPDSKNPLCLSRDCGQAANTIMGLKDKPAAQAEYGDGQESAVSAQPSTFRAQILGWMGSDRDKYMSKNEDQADVEDKNAGINRYAMPDVGEAYTIVPSYDNTTRWGYHFAGVILAPGHDRVTAENEAVGQPVEENHNWKFQTFGPPTKPGQSFHDQEAKQWAGSRSEGAMTITVKNPRFGDKSVREIMKVYDDKQLREHWGGWPWHELEKRSIEIKTEYFKFHGWREPEQGHVTFELVGPGAQRKYASGWWTVSRGDSDTWRVPIKRLIGTPPQGKSMNVELAEYKGESLVSFTWPYSGTNDALPFPTVEASSNYARVTIGLSDLPPDTD